LRYGYPKESLEAALRGRIDAIICDAGSAQQQAAVESLSIPIYAVALAEASAF
jgi:hypothetical protein